MGVLKWLYDTFISHDSCYEKYKSKDGKCYGVVGGNWNTDYLSEACVNCKHHCMLPKKGCANHERK